MLMMQKITGFELILWIITVLLFAFLFAGAPEEMPTRSLMHLWDFGHIVLFALLCYLILNRSEFLRKRSFGLNLLWITLFSLAAGSLTELIQIGFNRTADVSDILRDITGGMIPLVFWDRINRNDNKRSIYALRVFTIILILYFLMPVIVSAIDEHHAKNQLPVLSDFQSSFELTRWSEESKAKIVEDAELVGNRLLQVNFSSEEYAGITLKYFPSDWREYRLLAFDIKNPQQDTFKIEFRVNDVKHLETGQTYEDRYNSEFDLSPGLNQIQIDLDKVRQAPKNRAMDMGDIHSFRLFFSKAPYPLTFYLDNVQLKK
jgi:hypothetical protein